MSTMEARMQALGSGHTVDAGKLAALFAPADTNGGGTTQSRTKDERQVTLG